MIRRVQPIMILLLLCGCTLTAEPIITPTVTEIPSTLVPSHVGEGICFEAALDAAGEVFVFRSADAVQQFYDLADSSGLCRNPVERVDVALAPGQAIAGLWSAGRGCTARHEVQDIQREVARITITLDFVTEGDCPYELVQPFWVVLDETREREIVVIVRDGG